MQGCWLADHIFRSKGITNPRGNMIQSRILQPPLLIVCAGEFFGGNGEVGHSVHCRMFSHIHGFSPLDASIVLPFRS